ncbi:hypothetical protein KC356_g301 [Hortaea werneckii]|nr:hypothetical protein KC356_g301 [Hortaea werneckii]
MSWKTVAEQQQSDLQQLQSRIDGLNRTVVERENTIHDLRFRLASTEEKLTSLENSITNTDTVPPAAAFQDFQRHLQAVEVEKAQLAQHAERAGAQLEYSLAEFRQFQQQAETQISHLRSKLAEYEQSRTNPPAVSGHVAVSTNASGNRNGPQRRPLAQSRITSARREDNACPPFLRNDDEDDAEPDLAYMQKLVPGEPSSGPSHSGLSATPAAVAGQQARIDGQAPQTGPSTTPPRLGVSSPSTNPPRVRGGQTKTIDPVSSTPPPQPTKPRPRRPKRNYSTFQDDDDDEYRPDATSQDRATPPSSHPTPSKTRRLRKSTTAAAAATSKNPLPTPTSSSSSSEGNETSSSPPSHSFPLPFKAVTFYTPPTSSSPNTVDPQTGEWTVAEYFASEEISSELGELWDRLAVVREKWEVFKGPGWLSAAAGGDEDWEQTMAWLERKSFTHPHPRGGRGANGDGWRPDAVEAGWGGQGMGVGEGGREETGWGRWAMAWHSVQKLTRRGYPDCSPRTPLARQRTCQN